MHLATRSPYSHCGILFRRNGEWRVYEPGQLVSETSLAVWVNRSEWVDRGKSKQFVVKRLRDAENVLTPAALQQLQAIIEQHSNKDNELAFGWSTESIPCSELLWKMYRQATGREIGKLQTLREFDLNHPAVQAKLQERYGKRIPLDEGYFAGPDAGKQGVGDGTVGSTTYLNP
ncbi:YiiX/YebB-like N1pC/P60 family cysteine hydrolase [Hymenobacter sp. HSC-4F20]|uniref:YiiX/YebB-like N1pC/P60 family cysteine hydrolase n=1 Tax=Hymenobacter sp. HSC-4F20 TaxID=2864135 RepID=UPI00287729D5|nr:YiiX/YebB-like N1pC/P60 family cysteine hydrolase [Hymenobacter sp. HSC-4F20]